MDFWVSFESDVMDSMVLIAFSYEDAWIALSKKLNSKVSYARYSASESSVVDLNRSMSTITSWGFIMLSK